MTAYTEANEAISLRPSLGLQLKTRRLADLSTLVGYVDAHRHRTSSHQGTRPLRSRNPLT